MRWIWWWHLKKKRESNVLIPEDIREDKPSKLVDEDESQPIMVSQKSREKSLLERGIEELQRQGYTDIQAEMQSEGDYDEVAL